VADHKHIVDEVDAQGNRVSTVAECSIYGAAVAAFEAVVRQNPNSRYMLRHGSRIIKRSHTDGQRPA
jgi:hypothetical protein